MKSIFKDQIKIPGKAYLVGGYVRDHLLGLKVSEKDHVVIGATPKQMLDAGFKQVGKEFPVFLHPITHEEYALARTEKKQSPGYYGFKCNFNPNVSLKEDLMRRDLTINAIAMDENENIIDFFGGQKDIEKRQLRHVSNAFKEDPVRLLRIARFKTKFASFNFEITQKTQQIMRQIVKQGEADHLIPERIWKEFVKTLEYPNIEIFFNTLDQCKALEVILPEIKILLLNNQKKENYHAFNECKADKKLYLGFMLRKLNDQNIKNLLSRIKASNQFIETSITASQIYQFLKNDKQVALDYLNHFRKWDIFRRPEKTKKILSLYQKTDVNQSQKINWIFQAISNIEQINTKKTIGHATSTQLIKQRMEKAYLESIASAILK